MTRRPSATATARPSTDPEVEDPTPIEEYLVRRKQLGILDLFGTIDIDPAYDYKRERQGWRTWSMA